MENIRAANAQALAEHGLERPRIAADKRVDEDRTQLVGDAVPPILEGEVRVEAPEFSRGGGRLRLGRHGVHDGRRGVHERMLRRLPDLPRALDRVLGFVARVGGRLACAGTELETAKWRERQLVRRRRQNR